MMFSRELSKLIISLCDEDLTLSALDNAKTVILDTLGCALAGANEPAVEMLVTTPGIATKGNVRLIGRTERLDVLNAALVNGTAAHALDFDDVNTAMGGHPSAPVLSALMACCELAPYSGRELLLAFITGFETETRLARAVNFHHYQLGWHPTATLGVFGAAAACAKLMKLNEEQVATSLAFSASLASGLKANFGTMTKPFHVGHAARHGLMATLMARQGWTASADAFEHEQGFFNVFNGKGNYNFYRAFEEWAAPLDIVSPGIGIKLYPCCDSTHTSIDAVRLLHAEHQFNEVDIERIEVMIHPLRLTHINRPNLRSATDAKFSVQYCIACMLIDKKIDFNSFSPLAYENSKVQALMSKIQVFPHPTPEQSSVGNYLTDLRIQMKDGIWLEKRMEQPLGRHIDEPAPLELILEKFESCASLVLKASAVKKLSNAVMSIENFSDASELVKLSSLDT